MMSQREKPTETAQLPAFKHFWETSTMVDVKIKCIKKNSITSHECSHRGFNACCCCEHKLQASWTDRMVASLRDMKFPFLRCHLWFRLMVSLVCMLLWPVDNWCVSSPHQGSEAVLQVILQQQRVCVCVFLHLLHTGYQNTHLSRAVRAFWLFCGLTLWVKVKVRVGVRVWSWVMHHAYKSPH